MIKEEVLKYGLLLAVAYLVLSKVTGLVKGEQKSATSKSDLTNPYSPLSPLYLKSEYAKKKASGKNYSIPLFKASEAERRAVQVYSAKGIVKDVDDSALSALNCEYKTQVAQIADSFEKKYNRSMLDYLNGFLDTENMNILTARVQKMK